MESMESELSVESEHSFGVGLVLGSSTNPANDVAVDPGLRSSLCPSK